MFSRSANENSFPYDDLIYHWMGQGRLEFDRETLRAACAREGLLGQGEGRPSVYGVKSFEHGFDRLEDRCTKVLNLVPAFDERQIRSDADWSDTLYPELNAFLVAAANEDMALRLALDAHVTLAFAAGSILNIKSGRHVELEQRRGSRRIWAANDLPRDPTWSTLTTELSETGSGGQDMAVAVGLTHDVGPDVRRYLGKAVPSVGRILTATPNSKPARDSVCCGRHASDLAAALTALIRAEREKAPIPTIHLFVAAPNAFTFFLGQHQQLMGQAQLYEFDFEGTHGGSYKATLTLPIILNKKIS